MTKNTLTSLQGLSEKDQKMIKDADHLLGSEPEDMGFVKHLFWGKLRENLVFPYPESRPEDVSRCERLLANLSLYLDNEHPSIQIDQEEEIPQWCLTKLFEMGVMGMTIPREYGGLGLGISSYNRVLSRIGARCSATAVVVSAHQSIGCKSLMLFGTDAQKKTYLPSLARQYLSAFCLSEPNVGCDAGGQETTYNLSEDGQHFIINGEKKWSTSGAISGLFTVIAKRDELGETKPCISAFIVMPDTPGVHVTEKNRSKCGIRGTWQARIKFTDVKVPVANLLSEEGQGLKIALTCLNYGRCTLSAGMLGSANHCLIQSVKWSQTRYQFGRPLCDFELVASKIAEMSALSYAMDAMLYMTTNMLDRRDEDMMVETAVCKLFCSEMGWRIINDAVQIMGGESYMTENEIERAFRDSRIFLIVEGANEVMFSFIFGYGGKQLAEYLIQLKNAFYWTPSDSFLKNGVRILKNCFNLKLIWRSLRVLLEIGFGLKKKKPKLNGLHPSLKKDADLLCSFITDLSYHFKKTSFRYQEKMVSMQVMQSRIANAAVWIHAMSCVLSKLDKELKINAEKDILAGRHFLAMAILEIKASFEALTNNADHTMSQAAKSTLKWANSIPNSKVIIPETSPNAKGTGRTPDQTHIRQFASQETYER